MARATRSGRAAPGRGGGDDSWNPIAYLAASRFKDSEIFTSGGPSGRVVDVFLSDDGQQYAAVDFGGDIGTHHVPISKLIYESNRFVLPDLEDTDVRSLPVFAEGQAGFRNVAPDATIDIRGYRIPTLTDDNSIVVQQAAPQVTVERPALAIHWEQAAPRVTVHQATPQVNVRQSQPVITVRQPPPTITVELAEPEIIVRIAEPEVDVSIADPEVQVSIPRPRVQVVQPDEPVVDISSSEPLVSLLPRNRAEVSIERNQPQVFYERIGEPQVIFRQTNGQPRIRFEELTAEEGQGLASVAATTALPAARFEGREVYDSAGEKVGTVRRLLVGQKGTLFVVLDRGGFLSPHKSLLRIDTLKMSGDRLTLPEMTEADLRNLGDWDESMDSYVPAADDILVRIPFRL